MEAHRFPRSLSRIFSLAKSLEVCMYPLPFVFLESTKLLLISLSFDTSLVSTGVGFAFCKEAWLRQELHSGERREVVSSVLAMNFSLEKYCVTWPVPVVPLFLDCLLIPGIKGHLSIPWSNLKAAASPKELRVDQLTSTDSGCVGGITNYCWSALNLRLFHKFWFH